jgi:ABC-type antimicrobial peptide transport system permease subunit
MLLLLVTAALAAVLAAIAIYGSIWYAVTQRIPEIGIRLALGATRVSVCAGIFRNAMALTALGVVVGTSAVIGARPLLTGFLFETPATDASTFSAVIGGILAVTTLACIAPAWRAMHVDPVVALRSE